MQGWCIITHLISTEVLAIKPVNTAVFRLVVQKLRREYAHAQYFQFKISTKRAHMRGFSSRFLDNQPENPIFRAILRMHMLYCTCALSFLLGCCTIQLTLLQAQDAHEVKQLAECKKAIHDASKTKVSVYTSQLRLSRCFIT